MQLHVYEIVKYLYHVTCVTDTKIYKTLRVFNDMTKLSSFINDLKTIMNIALFKTLE